MNSISPAEAKEQRNEIFKAETPKTLYRFFCQGCGYKKESPERVSFEKCPECLKEVKRIKPRDESWRIRVDRSQ